MSAEKREKPEKEGATERKLWRVWNLCLNYESRAQVHRMDEVIQLSMGNREQAEAHRRDANELQERANEIRRALEA